MGGQLLTARRDRPFSLGGAGRSRWRSWAAGPIEPGVPVNTTSGQSCGTTAGGRGDRLPLVQSGQVQQGADQLGRAGGLPHDVGRQSGAVLWLDVPQEVLGGGWMPVMGVRSWWVASARNRFERATAYGRRAASSARCTGTDVRVTDRLVVLHHEDPGRPRTMAGIVTGSVEHRPAAQRRPGGAAPPPTVTTALMRDRWRRWTTSRWRGSTSSRRRRGPWPAPG